MASFLEYAMLSQNTYTSKPISLKSWAKISDVAPTVRPNNNFYGVLYVNFKFGKAHEAVIAIRGTVSSKIDNELEDVYSWFSSAAGTDWHDHLPTYFPQALVFARKALRYLKTYYPSIRKISYTGHSLGGALAQLLALRGRPYKAVVFNSPGCKEIAGKYLDRRKNLVTSINSRYGVINKIGQLVLGNLVIVDVPNYADQAKLLVEHFNKQDFKRATEFAKATDILSCVGVEPITSPFTMAAAELSALYRLESVADSVSTVNESPVKIIEAQHSIKNMVLAIRNYSNIHTMDVEHILINSTEKI